MKDSCLSSSGSERPVARGFRSISLLVTLAVVAFLVLVSLPSFAAPSAAWWDNAWLYRVPVTIQNADGSADLPSRYSVKLTTDTGLLVRTGRLAANCNDLRLVYFDGAVNYEIDRLIDGCATGQTQVWFSLQQPIPAASQDSSYYVYYGNASSSSAPSNGMNVFLFYEDWDNGSNHWTNAGGLDPTNSGTMGTSLVSSDTSVSPTQSQEFIQKTMGGDAFSGLIPVTPSTRYEISVWATSATPAYLPVGFDPYSSGYSRGSEVWLWTSEWSLSSQWVQRAAAFTTDAGTAFLKIKSEWWNEGPGSAPVYSDNLRLRYASTTEPTVTPGIQEVSVPAPVLTNVQAASPVTSGSPTDFSVDVSQSDSVVDRVTVHLLSPQATDIAMNLANGTDTSGTWTAQFIAPRRGIYNYVVSAHAANGSVSVSTPQAFTVVDNLQSSWWDHSWLYRAAAVVQNTSSSESLPVHYSVRLTVDTSLLVRTGQLLPNCNDLRVVSFDGNDNYELDRLIENCAASQTTIWFAIQRPVSAGAQDSSYYVYYGNSSAGPAPSNGINVFVFYEDWENGSTHWTSAGGLDTTNSGTMGTSAVSTDTAWSATHSQKFAQKTTGGDAFTGFIPVTPNSRYEISVWATSATAAYFPVGFDPYTSGYIRGSEVWLWTNEWALSPPWTQRAAFFTSDATAAFLKIKSEWWNDGPGSAPVYSDNIRLRYALAGEPTVANGSQEATIVTPTISNVQATTPVQAGTSVTVSANISQGSGAVDSAIVHVFSPQTLDIPLQLLQGSYANGTWTTQFVASEGGAYTYTVSAHATNGAAATSPYQTFTVVDTVPPQITLVSVTDPILIKNTQTLTVQVADNGQVSAVSVSVDGISHPMTPNANQYTYSWKVLDSNTVTYTVQATDSSGNGSTLPGSFTVQPREADICTWRGCKQGAESFSIDDSNNSCRHNLEDAGFRGTYYHMGGSSYDWLADYSAAGHEIGSHTVDHLCNTPCCTPYCTIQSLYQCQSTPDQVTAYRQNEFEPNIDAIELVTKKPVITAAWPCGCTDPGRQSAAAPYFIGARGYYDYVAQLTWVENVDDITPMEPMNLYAAHAYDQTFIDRAASEGKWAIIVSHGDCTGIDYMGQRQDVLWAAPVGDVLKYIKVRDAANFANYLRSGNVINFDISQNLGTFQRQKVDGTYFLPITYDNPVTVKVHILDTEGVLSVLVNSSPVVYSVQKQDGSTFVLFDSSLEVPRHVVVTVGATPAISTVTLDPATVAGGSPSTGTVTLSSLAPAGGALVTLLSSNVTLAQVSASVRVPAGSTTATFPVTTSTVTSETTVAISGTYSGTTRSANLILDPTRIVVDLVVLNPNTVISGNSSTGTVTLSGPAPSNGITVNLNSDDPAALAPSSVSIAGNQTSATFPVTTTPVSVDTSANIIASYNGDSAYGTLTLIPVIVSSLSTTPTSVIGGNPATGTVTLSVAAPAGGAVVVLSSNNPVAQVPVSVTVPANARTVTFGITTSVVAADTAVTLSGSYNNTSQSVTLTVRPVPPIPSSLGLNPTSVIGGTSSTATLTLDKPSPAGGTLVTLSSNNSAARVPASVTVPANSSTATFTVTTSPVRTAASATISATANGSATSAVLTVRTAGLATVSVNPQSVIGGSSSTATVTLDGPAPSGGSVIALASSNTAAAQVPSSVTIAANAVSATFAVTTRGVGATTAVTISATYNSATQTAGLTVNPASLVSLSLNPSTVLGGASSVATVTLDGAAPSGGAVVTLTSSNTAAAQVPSSVTIAANATSGTFTVTTKGVAGVTPVTISAAYNSVTKTAGLTINPAGLSSLSLNPTSPVGGSSSVATVTLSGAAPPSGAIVTITSSNPTVAQVPGTVTIAANATTTTFNIATTSVTSTTSVTISSRFNSVTRTATLTVTPLALSSLSLSPSSVVGGSSSTGTVTLNGNAAVAIVVSLNSSNSAIASVPLSVTVPAGSSAATFTVNTNPVSSSTSPTISALYNGTTRSQALTVNSPSLSSLTLNPTTVKGGNPSTGTVTLNGPAPTAGASVTLSSSNTSVATVPTSVTVPAGSTSTTFTVTTRTVTFNRSVTITGTRNGTRSATLTVTP